MQRAKEKEYEYSHNNRRTQKNPKTNSQSANNVDINNINRVEYLSAVNINGLLQKVRAAIFLSLDELWSIPTELVLIATILDPRFKNFHWDASGEEKNKSHELLQQLYDSKKVLKPQQPANTQWATSSKNNDDDDDFFKVLENNENLFNNEEEDEVLHYIKLQQIDITEDPLKWWDINKSSFKILSQLAKKYLSIPASSVPSERLFSDAGNYISAKRTQLSPELVNQVLFLKRNCDHFNIFPSQDI